MPRKAFIADLSEVMNNTQIPGVSNVRKGGDDGEFIFTMDPALNRPKFDLTSTILDVSEYPSSHTCFFSVSDDAPAWVASKLEDLSSKATAMPVPLMLGLVSKSIYRYVESDDVEMVDSQDYHSDFDDAFDSDPEDDEAEEYFPDDMLSLQLPTQGGHTSALPTMESTSPFRSRIRMDLRAAKAAGFKVGYLGSLLEGGGSYVTVSIRLARLGISAEAMQAWQVRANEYLVLILYYPMGYQSMDTLTKMDPEACRRALGIRVGVSNTYKPTLQEAVHAFTRLAKEESKDQANSNVASEPVVLNLGFRNAFISGALNEFLNERLLKIITFRYNGMTWGGAEEFLSDHMASTTAHSDLLDEKYLVDDRTDLTYPKVVLADHITEAAASQPHSFPLIAMQALLRHFVRCTEFCLVCFRRLPDDLEAIKPYVCDNPLCLYQYMSLGFGPSIEHEILAQPNVVDLLISFCYISARLGGLHTYPSGLSLMVPDTNATTIQKSGGTLPGGIRVKYDHGVHQLIFEAGQLCPFRAGDWVVVRMGGIDFAFHARVKETTYFPTVNLGEFVEANLSPVVPQDQGRHPNYYNMQQAAESSSEAKAKVEIPAGIQFADIFLYDRNFDDLNDAEKRSAICNLLDITPGVVDLKSYLDRKGVTSLANWVDRLPPAAVGLLRWIIASSRACILEAEGSNGDASRRDERLQGMDGWLQFRFAMGAPDKERRFISAVKSTTERKNLTYPTLFAWHGSPLSNWHSIIREGLHFNKVSNGRAFGNGVYHSLQVQTSMGYSQYHHFNGSAAGFGSPHWPQSHLKVACALALNEIVNAPDEYTSRNPHLVVQHVEWIQTRYLFIKVGSQFTPEKVADIQDVRPQDPSMTPQGEGGKMIVPNKAVAAPKKRSTPSGLKSSIAKRLKGGGKKDDPINLDDDDEEDFDDGASVKTTAEDRDILKEEESLKDGSSQGFMSIFTKSAKPQTDFVPGELDHSTLPVLSQPAWASISATKRLQQDFKALLKVQGREPLHELGWYIDPELITNMYQWIVELHSFEERLPLAKDMKAKGLKSIVLELRFGKDYPMSPPFVRVIRPRFLSFLQGGGGHVTAGGALCMELLTNNGWSAVSSIESVLLQVRLAISSTDPRPAKLEQGAPRDYGVGEAVEAYIRACQTHGWSVPEGFREMAYGGGQPGQAF